MGIFYGNETLKQSDILESIEASDYSKSNVF